PAGMPDAVVSSLNDAFRTAMTEPDIQATLASQGIVEAEQKTPEELAGFIRSEVKKWHDVMSNASIELN
ncbi:MAG: tripartite tricarboxylate transporter substrate-binding protein, partial [Advenella sp.]